LQTFSLNLEPVYEEWKKRVAQEGRKEGLKEGKKEGKKEEGRSLMEGMLIAIVLTDPAVPKI
jgi:predicted transposase YdaD